MADTSFDPSLPVWGDEPTMDAYGAEGDGAGWDNLQRGMNAGSQGLGDVLKLISTAAQLDPKSAVNQQQKDQAEALRRQYEQAAATGNAQAQAQIQQLVAAQQAQTQAMLAEQNKQPGAGFWVAVGAGVLGVVGIVVALVRR